MGRIQPFSLGLGMDLQHSGNAAGGTGFSILRDLQPDFATDSRSVLDALGQPPEYLETVATWRNLVDGPVGDGVQSTANRQPLMLAHANGENYLHLPGVSSNYATVSYDPAFDVGTHFTIEAEMEPHGASNSCYSSHWGGSMAAYVFHTDGANYRFVYTVGGLTYEIVRGPRSAGFPPVRVVRDGESIAIYEKLDDDWVMLGEPEEAPAGAMGGGSDGPMCIGSWNGDTWSMRGKSKRFRIWDNVTPDTTEPVLDVDFSTFAHGATSGDAATGQTVTIHQSGGDMAKVIGHSVFRLDGVDDRFELALSMDGPMTFVTVMELTDKNQQILWAVDSTTSFTCNIDDDALPTENPPSGVGVYRMNGAPLSVSSRADLLAALPGNRVLLVNHYTFVVGVENSPMLFGGIDGFGGFQLQGDVEAILVFKRILTPQEIAKLEASLMARYGIS